MTRERKREMEIEREKVRDGAKKQKEQKKMLCTVQVNKAISVYYTEFGTVIAHK